MHAKINIDFLFSFLLSRKIRENCTQFFNKNTYPYNRYCQLMLHINTAPSLNYKRAGSSYTNNSYKLGAFHKLRRNYKPKLSVSSVEFKYVMTLLIHFVLLKDRPTL